MKTKLFSVYIAFVFFSQTGFTQNVGICPSGKYLWSVSKDSLSSTLTVRSTSNTWKTKISWKGGKGVPKFSTDEHYITYDINDSLYIWKLGTTDKYVLPGVSVFKEVTSDAQELIAYKLKSEPGDLELYNVVTDEKHLYKNVRDFSFSDNGHILLLTIISPPENQMFIDWVEIKTGVIQRVWYPEDHPGYNGQVFNCILNGPGNQMAFMIQEKGSGKNSIWCFQKGMKTAELLADDHTPGIDSGLFITDKPLSFSASGTKVFFALKERPLTPRNKNFIKLDVWSYLDPRPQPLQLKDAYPHSYTAVSAAGYGRVLRLERPNEQLIRPNRAVENDDYVLVCHFNDDVIDYAEVGGPGNELYTMGSYNWNKELECSVYLMSLRDGKRIELSLSAKCYSGYYPYYRFSPSGKYVLYYKPDSKNYYSYNIANGTTSNLTKAVKTLWEKAEPEAPAREYWAVRGIAAWLSDGSDALIYDHYGDLWKVDLSGRRDPIDITSGYAKKNAKTAHSWGLANISGLSSPNINGDIVYLYAENSRSNCLNYYREKLDDAHPRSPELLLDASSYRYSDFWVNPANNLFLFRRESYTDPLDYFLTKDFRYPPQAVTSGNTIKKEGIRTETIQWKTFDGTPCFGVLYYPEHFDSRKKYPVIFDYYEQFSFLLVNQFSARLHRDKPALAVDYCTSQDYFFFVPDIHYKIGDVGQSVYNSLVSAANCLSKKPYIDHRHMGVQGHSFGGYETNLLIGKTKIFAAACSGSGMTDMISLYGTDDGDPQGYSEPAGIETGQNRVGVTIWDRPDLYLKNSPVFYADRVTTPLLMGVGKQDLRVPPNQSIEFFSAMRRLGKKVWLLSYDDADHGLTDDWEIRAMQFFDHYLKSKPAPIWMTRGIPAKMKGLTLGLAYDTTIKTPGPGITLKDENKTPRQKILLKHATTVNADGQIVPVKHK